MGKFTVMFSQNASHSFMAEYPIRTLEGKTLHWTALIREGCNIEKCYPWPDAVIIGTVEWESKFNMFADIRYHDDKTITFYKEHLNGLYIEMSENGQLNFHNNKCIYRFKEWLTFFEESKRAEIALLYG